MSKMRRRDLFLAAATAAAAASLGATGCASNGSAALSAQRDKRRAQYRPDAPGVQAFYRVNRYPSR